MSPKPIIFGLCVLTMLLSTPLASAQTEETAIYTTTINYVVQNIGSNIALNSQVVIVLFDNSSGWASQEVLSEQITVDDSPISPQIFSTDDNRWTVIQLGDLNPGQSKTISVVQVLKVDSVDLSIDPDLVGTTFPSELSVYTVPVDGLFESDDSDIQALAQQLTDNVTNPYYKARKIFDYLLENLDYEPQLTEHSALWGLQAGRGDCTEFSNLFIALARAAGIPSKLISGFGYLALYTPGASTDIEELGHAWSIFYLPNYGWVPADAVWPRYIGSFGETDYAHMVGAVIGGEGVVNEQGEIIWHAPRYIKRNWSQYTGQPTELGGSVSGSIVPEILLDVGLQASSQIQDDVLSLTATVKNMGRNQASNLVAELEVDPAYFEVITPPQQKSSLASGEQWTGNFDVRLKEGAYDNRHTFTSKVTYDSSYQQISGPFLAKGEISVSIPARPVAPGQAFDIMLFALIGVFVGVIVVVVVALVRR